MLDDSPPQSDQHSDEGQDDAPTLDLRGESPTSGSGQPDVAVSGASQTSQLAGAAAGGSSGGPPGQVTLDVSGIQQPRLELTPYVPEKQQDYVRLIVTVGLLLMFAWVIVWASIESASWHDHWEQTKDMLQIILPALTGLIGSVLGFYFGSRGTAKPSS